MLFMAEVGGNETWICAKKAIGTERSRLCSRMAVPPESRRSGSLARCDYGVSGLAQMAQYEQRDFLATGLSERLSQALMAHTGRKKHPQIESAVICRCKYANKG